ncbi:MAG: hypothetical protein KC983_11280 [Phycisphaerales bacterium]|nr:hypothetical protein [Phycisphaerales bacterium]
MSRFGTDYQVARPTGLCAATGIPLEPGMECVATLVEREDDEGFDRRDFCVNAWEDGAGPDHLFSYWKTTVPEPNKDRRVFVDDEVLFDVFNRLADDDRPQRKAFRFVLALILLRKKQLKFAGRDGDGTDASPEFWLMLPKGSEPDDPPLRVQNPHLTDDDVRELTEQLREVLQGDL